LRKLATLAAMFGLLITGGAGFLHAKTFSFPHVLETSGKITDGPSVFDSTFHMIYTPSILGGGSQSVEIKIYFFDQVTGDLVKRADGQNACGPCIANLSDTKRKESYRLDDFITRTRDSNGGAQLVGNGLPGVALPYPTGKAVITGYAIATVSNDDANVNMVNFVVNSITGPLQVSVFASEPKEISAPATP